MSFTYCPMCGRDPLARCHDPHLFCCYRCRKIVHISPREMPREVVEEIDAPLFDCPNVDWQPEQILEQTITRKEGEA